MKRERGSLQANLECAEKSAERNISVINSVSRMPMIIDF